MRKATDSAFLALSVPESVLVSDHGFPSPELADDPIAMIRAVFEAIGDGARKAGLTDRGVVIESRRESDVAWGSKADVELQRREARLEGMAARGFFWPWGHVAWADPERVRSSW